MGSNQKGLGKFQEYLSKGILLLNLKEFGAFHFDVDLKDPNYQELTSLLKEEDIEETEDSFKKIESRANKILKRTFTQDKKRELLAILKEIEKQYSNDKETSFIAYTSKIFLEDKEAKHYRLPLAVVRLTEDVSNAIKEERS